MLCTLIDSAPANTPALVAEGQVTTFGDLAERSRRLARGLAGLGIRAGDRVAIWLPNDPAWLVSLFACARLGAIAIAVNTRFRSSEIADIVGRSRARLLIHAPGLRGIHFAGILEQTDPAALSNLIARVAVGTAAPAGTLAFDALLVNDGRIAGDADPDSGCLVFTTSGTTRAPKFVLHSPRTLAVHAAEVASGFCWRTPGTRLLQTLPYAGTFGMTQALAALAARAPSHVPAVFDVEAAADLIARERITNFNASDEMIRRLLETDRDLSSVREVGYAAFDPSLGDIAERAAERGLALFGLYGASEVQALYARQPAGSPLPLRRRPGGTPVSPSARFRVRDPESGELIGLERSGGVVERAGALVERAGALELSGPSRMLGYLDDEAATRAALTEDGFVRMGDLAHRDGASGQGDGEGGFVYEARMGDVLRLGGYLVAPEEIEARLQGHPTIEKAQVVSINGRRGPVAVAFVVARAGRAIDEQALIGWCASALARYKVPAAVIVLDAFPVTQSANGTKIQRAALRGQAAAALAERF